jgi:hypothetical protein
MLSSRRLPVSQSSISSNSRGSRRATSIALTTAACASSSRAAPAACTPADLRVSAAYSQSATQHAIYDLTFTNASPAACNIQGYPACRWSRPGTPAAARSGHPGP